MRTVIFLLLVVVTSSRFVSAQDTIVAAKVRVYPFLKKLAAQDLTVEVDDSATFAREFNKYFPASNFSSLGKRLFLIHKMSPSQIERLLQIAAVKSIDRGKRRAVEETVLGNFDLSVNSVTTVHGKFPTITGNGLTLSVKEKPFDTTDIDLRHRIKFNNYFDEGSTLHATIMATIGAGAGNSSPFAKGAAWGSFVTTSDFERLLPDDDNYFALSNASVQNHSYGVGLENYYGIESREYDLFCQRNPGILHVFSSGNQGDQVPTQGPYANTASVANLTGQFKTSKNTIAVGTADRTGNVVAKSSRGPAYDGRVKPEVIAFGDAGSSEAAAVVSGIALLIQDAYRVVSGELPNAALVKAVLINSAMDVGRANVDFETGFGNANALDAVKTVKDGRFFSGTISLGVQKTFVVNVGQPAGKLKVTLAWADPAGETFNQRALVNDLDLTVKDVSQGQTYDPWVLDASPILSSLTKAAVRGKDRINNVEQVTIDFSQPGSYQITVNGIDIRQGPQQFFVAYQVDSGFEWLYPMNSDHLPASSEQVIRWKSFGKGQGSIEYRSAQEAEWRVIANNIPLDEGSFGWTTPNQEGLYRLRITSNSGSFESDTFSVSVPRRVQVGFDCSQEFMVHWIEAKGSSKYRLLHLGERYLEPVLETKDTFAVVPKSEASTFLAIVPVFGATEGTRELTIDYTTQGVGCYFISVLPHEQIVNSQAIIDVKLGTVLNIESATLERIEPSLLASLNTLTNIGSTSFSFSDNEPLEGWNDYRIRVSLTNGDVIYSDTVSVFFVEDNQAIVYPNPVTRGNDINIISSNSNEARVTLVDITGRIVRESSDSGYTKVISTEGLLPGIYMVGVQDANGRMSFARVILR